MTTQYKIPLPGKGLLLLTSLSLAAMALASPSMAHGNRGPMYGNGSGYNNTRYMNSPRQQYPWLNRINQYGVRGKIVKWGRGPLQGCFKVKRTGRYQGDSAIVTVRYCLDHYGQARIDRGSKRLVRYLNYYRPAANTHNYRQPMARY
jgi:hypothetical protein